MNTSKIHLQVGEFSLKTTWKLAESPLYNQGSKKELTELGGKEEELSGWNMHPWEETWKKREISHWWRSARGSEWFKSHIGV